MPHRRRRIMLSRLAIAVVGVLLTGVLASRVRARQEPSDWFQSKNLTLAPVVKGLKEPTYVVGAPDGSNRLFILERAGLVRVAEADGQLRSFPLLDLSQHVSLGNEEGLLGFAFDPSFAQNGYVYVSYTALDWSVQVVRYTMSPDPDVVDPSTAQVVLVAPKRSKYHNAGMVAFGPDGYLYVSIGDDEASERAQDLGTLTGKILRLDVDSATQPYTIPATNPFVDTDARGEVWASGLRNPWRFSFDRVTGDMWIGDVHHVDDGPGPDSNWEAVDFQPANSSGGLNYGFPMRATFHCADIASCRPPGVTLPVIQYGHNMNCSVTGGYVYRGKSAAGLTGAYIFGDYCTGGVFALRGRADQGWSPRLELGYQPIKISSFGEDAGGELYVVDIQGGTIYRIVAGSLP